MMQLTNREAAKVRSSRPLAVRLTALIADRFVAVEMYFDFEMPRTVLSALFR